MQRVHRNPFLFLLCLPALLLALSACSSNDKEARSEELEEKLDTNYSGFLTKTHYDLLKEVRVPSDHVVFRYLSPRLGPENYDAVIVEPVVFYPQARPNEQVPQETLATLQSALEDLLRDNISLVVPLTTDPGPRVMRAHLAITGVDVDDEGLRPLEYLPIGFLYAKGSEATGSRTQEVRIYLESKVVDSQSGELLAAGVREITGPDLDNAREQLEAKQLNKGLDIAGRDLVQLWKSLWEQ